MNSFVDFDFYQEYKHRQHVGGDVFSFTKIKKEDRTIVVLSDGLGSGIKAGVLATLTATIASKLIINHRDIKQTAQIIMSTLPVCKVRKISYATFTIIDIKSSGETKIIEYDNPAIVVIRGKEHFNLNKEVIKIKNNLTSSRNKIAFSTFTAQPGDRIITISDGITQSGMGSKEYPLGWGLENYKSFITKKVTNSPQISSRALSNSIVKKAVINDNHLPKDDTTCGVVYFRKPRKLIVITGPPIDKNKDKYLGEIIQNYPGKKMVSGGTTAQIIGRELGKSIKVDLKNIDPKIPPSSKIEGLDLVTEGILTLSSVAEHLKKRTNPDSLPENPVKKVIELFLNSDTIEFIVGTKINEAHQDPNIPAELEIRRTIIKRIVKYLDRDYLKDVKLEFV